MLVGDRVTDDSLAAGCVPEYLHHGEDEEHCRAVDAFLHPRGPRTTIQNCY